MRKTHFLISFLAAASLLAISCGDMGTNNTANRPANNAVNTANTASPAANPAAVEAEVKKMMSDLAAALAKNDADAAARFYSDDYHLITLEGVDQDKATRIADMRSGTTKFDTFSYEDVKVRTYGDTAVAITKVKATGTLHGKPRPAGDLIATLVFHKGKDGWKVVSGQATPVTAPATKPAAANTAANSSANTAANK